MTLVDANHCPGMPLEESIALASAAEGSWVQFLREKLTAMCSAPASVDLAFTRVPLPLQEPCSSCSSCLMAGNSFTVGTCALGIT